MVRKGPDAGGRALRRVQRSSAASQIDAASFAHSPSSSDKAEGSNWEIVCHWQAHPPHHLTAACCTVASFSPCRHGHFPPKYLVCPAASPASSISSDHSSHCLDARWSSSSFPVPSLFQNQSPFPGAPHTCSFSIK